MLADTQFCQHHLLNRLSFPTACFCLLCQKLGGLNFTGLFLGLLFCSTGLPACFFNARTRLSLSLQLCSIIWSGVLQSLHLCSYSLRLIWLFIAFCGSIWIIGLFSLDLWNMSLTLIDIAVGLWFNFCSRVIFTILILPL